MVVPLYLIYRSVDDDKWIEGGLWFNQWPNFQGRRIPKLAYSQVYFKLITIFQYII